MNNPICFVAGGSGGHVVPCVTIAQEYRERTNAPFLFFTSDRALEHSILKNYSFIENTEKLHLKKFPSLRFWRYPSFIVSFTKSCAAAFSLLKKKRPSKIISFGGAISIPVCLSGAALGIPIEIYEFNAIPGKAVRLLSYFAQRIYICFEQALDKLPASKCILTPYPVRFKTAKREALTPVERKEHKTILVLGGSQGSAFINSFVKNWLIESPLAPSLHIIHQTGAQHVGELAEFYKINGLAAQVFDYDNALDAYYHQADLVVCRAGAGSLFETLFFQKPCITIPLENCADNHQNANAVALAERYPELVYVLRQSDLVTDPELFDYALRIALHYEGQESGLPPSVNT
ncbi:MAG TPA: UDP-N-acetylglucosamine--N-acetylmuramyl-(pentapeptide) pyrophosphoryl-undecaprenol N-acetylglucosamine transferase [Candidatus Babeliales bacterium]|nr:UDP-N-acetylglucosamine--N-acetylmuramyl-(pentapeptide) pyrophosphoryl-undecaprenol N-acetylglucosamine transferase [Candidatus Babeliales bacterium]